MNSFNAFIESIKKELEEKEEVQEKQKAPKTLNEEVKKEPVDDMTLRSFKKIDMGSAN